MPTIKIDSELEAYANEQATADNVSLDVWCERKINGLVRRMIKDSLIEKVNSAKLDQISIYTTAVESAKKGIDSAIIENEAKVALLEPVAEDILTPLIEK